MPELMTSIIQAHQKIAGNYIKNYSGYHHDIRDITLTYSNLFSKLLINPSEYYNIYNLNLDFFQAQQALWKSILTEPSKSTPIIEPDRGDKRFLDPEWNINPYYNLIKQNYLLVSKLFRQIINEVEVDRKIKKKLNFYTEQYIDALSPANYLFTNPAAIRLAIETKGQSILEGLNNLSNDLEKGKISQSDDSAFEVSKNLAITPGAIIYENELIQLIQYTPITKNVFERPLIIIPPWINKFYILDLQQKNSFIKFLIEHGITVFMISWRNPDPSMGYLKLDDYVEKGALKAIEVAQSISNSKQVNMLGYCLGGTLLSIASSILSSSQKENPIHSATFLASMVDFSDIGPMGDVIDHALIRKLERGELLQNGIFNGGDMETAFNLIRANDLIWNYVVKNYLMGIKPAAFDVIFWTNDNTNLPADMYIYYMREMILENKLSRKNALRICNTPIDIGKINFPVIIIGFNEDTISPAKTVFTTTELVSGNIEFILGESGHVMGVVNPPIKNKYGYYINGNLGNGFNEWKNTATFNKGSWWTHWIEKLVKLSGKETLAPSIMGNTQYEFIEAAPGRYVKKKC